MKGNKHTPEQIIAKLREADAKNGGRPEAYIPDSDDRKQINPSSNCTTSRMPWAWHPCPAPIPDATRMYRLRTHGHLS